MATYNGNCGVDGGSNITWSLDTDSGSLVLTGSGEMENYSGNDTPWYTYSSYITNLTVGDGITSIGAYAFSHLNKLTNVTISNSVTSIGTEAFSYCSKLAEIIVNDNNTTYCSVDGVLFNKDRTTLIQYALGKTNTTYTIPEGTINIQGRAFAGSSALTSVVIPNSMTIINNSAFHSCSITSIVIPNNIVKIEESAFAYSNLTEIRIPSSVKEVGSGAFASCNTLTTVVIEEGLTSISSSMFASCPILRNVTIPETITEIGTSAFEYCSNLNNIILPNSLVTIDGFAFNEDGGLTNILIPDNVTSIGNGAFYYCTALSKATLGKNVSTIGSSIFDNCSSLKELEINSDIDNLSLNSLGTAVAIEKITLGEEVTKLTSNMLANHSSLNSFICKSTIIDVESGAFEGTGLIVEDETTQYIINSYTNKKWLISYVLSTVTNIPKDIELICSNALHTSSGNLKIVLPRSVNTVSKNSLVIDSSNAEIMFIFENNEVFLSSSGIVDITANTEAIIKLGFYYNMTNEQNLIALSNYAQAHGYETVFFYSNADEKITIVKFKNTNNIDCVTEFVNQDSECKISFNNIKTAIINEEAFCNRTDIKSLVIPITISQIKKGAFKGCTNINSITIPYIGGSKSGIIDSIDCAYFTWIFGLDKIEGETGTNITSGLPESVIVNSDITKIPANAFNRCYIIKNIELPITITSIGDYAFYYTGATIFNIPKYLKVIGNYAFYSTNLTNVNWNTTISCNEEDKQVGTNCFYMTSSVPKVNGYKFVDLNGNRFVCDEGDTNYTFDYNNGTISKDSSVVAYFSLAYYVFTRFSTPAQNSNFAENSGKCGSNLEWYLNEENDGSYTLSITGSGKMTNYSTSVRPGWEGKKSLIKNINISDNCTSIGDYAFYNYENITSINFPTNLVTIGQCAFSYCYSLTGDVVFNKNLKTIGQYAFYNCSNIISFEFNKGLTTINLEAFKGCSKVTEINIPTTVTLIEAGAFGNMAALEKATLPFVGASATARSNKSVLGYVFGGDSSSLYYTCTQIYFSGNSSNPISTTNNTFPISLKEIYILGGKVATGAFSGAKYIEKIVIDDNVTSIGTNIFWGMENLKEIKLPYKGTNELGYYYNASGTYTQNSSLSDANFIAGLFNFSPGTYTPYPEGGITFEVNNSYYIQMSSQINIITVTGANLSALGSFKDWEISGWTLNLPDNTDIYVPNGYFKNCNISCLNLNVLPQKWGIRCFFESTISKINNLSWDKVFVDTISVGQSAFYKASYLNGNIVFSKIQDIASWDTSGDPLIAGCFEGTSITGLEITNSNLITIGDGAFYDCRSLRTVKLHTNSVNKIGEQAFYRANIHDLTLNEGLTHIDLDAFTMGLYVEKLIIPTTVTTFGASRSSDNYNDDMTKFYGVFRSTLGTVKEIITPFVGWHSLGNSTATERTTLLWWFGGDEMDGEDSDYINGYWYGRKRVSTIPLEKIVITGTYNSRVQLTQKQFYDWKRKAPNLKIYFTNITSSQASIGSNCFTIYPNGTSVPKYWYFKGEFNESDVLPASSSKMSLRNASSYLRAGASEESISKATSNNSQRVMKLLANKDYAWKALLYGSNYDVYITDNNTYADGSSYLPTLYLPNNSKMKVGQQISLIGENTYKIANLEPFSCTNKIFYRQSKGILSGKLSYFNTTSGLVKYDDILRQWVIEEDSFKASLTSTPVNFTIGTTYDSNNIDGTIRIEDDIVYIENTGTTIEKADTITIEKAKVTEGSIDAELVNVVTENTKFTSGVDSQIQEIVSKNYYNITFSPGFYVSSNGYNTVTITIADKELILSDDLLTNTVLLSVDTKGTITLEGNTGENIKRGIISESLIGIIKKGETGFVLNDTHYIITDVNRSNNQIVFEDENNNGFIIQKIGEFKYDIALENYIDLASSDFNKTDLHLTLNYINIYEVSDIEPYTHLSNNVLRDGEILYLVTTTEVINPTNFEVTERSLEKDFSLERYTTLATVEGLEGESLQHILVYPDTFYEINSNYIETPQYYFQTSEKQDTIFYVNETEVSENASGIYEKTINSCSAKIEGEYKGDLIWYKWTIQEDIDGDYYTIDEFTEYYNPNIILNYDLFRNNTNYRLMLTIKTKENLEVESYLHISVEYGEDLLNGVTIDKDCIKKAIKIDFSQVREQKNLFDFDKFVTVGGYSGIQYVHVEDSDEKMYEYIGEEEYLYYNVYIPYNNNYVFSYKTNKVGVTSIRFYDKNKNNISSTIIDIIKDGFYDAEQAAITQTTTELIIPYIEGTNVAYFQVGFKVWQDGYFSELQLEVGTEATEYQPNNSSVDRTIERYIILREEANNDESLCKIAEIDSNVTYFYDYSFNREETYQYYVMPIFRNVVSGEEERGVPHKLNNQITYNLKEITLIDTKIELTIEDNYDLINDYEANIDEYSIWHLKYNTDAKNIEVVTDKAIYETSMKIPVVNKTARNYKTGTIKAFIGSFIKENDRLTYRDSIKLQNKFQEFCDNGRVKMLRDEIGNVLPVDITLQSFEYNPHTIPTNITVIFKWSQVGEEKNLSVWSKE